MFTKNSLLVTLISSFIQFALQIRVKTFKNKKGTFSDCYCLINTKFWITNEKMFIKKIIFCDVYYNCELQIRVKTFKNQKSKKISFSDFYWLLLLD